MEHIIATDSKIKIRLSPQKKYGFLHNICISPFLKNPIKQIRESLDDKKWYALGQSYKYLLKTYGISE